MTDTPGIALRFLLSRKRAFCMSIAGILFGVGFFIITQAQTSGFERFYIDTIVATDSPLRIQDRFQHFTPSLPAASGGRPGAFQIQIDDSRRYVEGIEYPSLLRRAVSEFEAVTAVSEVVRGDVQADSGFREQAAQVNGIRPEDHLAVTRLGEQIQHGDLADFAANPNAVLIGNRLADRLQVTAGDWIHLSAGGESRNYRIAAVFETGIGQIDLRRIFMHLNEARSLLRLPFGNALFQVNLNDIDAAPAVADQIRATLGHHAISWQEREKTWLEVFRALRVSSAITVSSIILISGLGMFNTLVMIVMEKTREIAILRSMGYTRRDIHHIFLYQGAIILLAGTLLGWAFGAFATYIISRLPIRIRGIFATDTFVVNWDPAHYLWAAVIAAVVVFIASSIPARRAARLEPGAVIRGASG